MNYEYLLIALAVATLTISLLAAIIMRGRTKANRDDARPSFGQDVGSKRPSKGPGTDL